MPTRTTYNTLAFIARCAVVGLAAAFVLSVFAPGLVERLRGRSHAGETMHAAAGDDAATTRHGPVSYADAVRRAAPAVVNIYANKATLYRPAVPVADALTQRLLGYVPGRIQRRQEQSLGSGVIFSSDGYVLTNNHVINGADDIQVLLDDGRVSKAQIIGTDAETDLAVLKIEANNLPEIAVPEDATADVGDVVLAIGNPFGLGKTVTMGIVSATGRQLRASSYEDFIQTDAAINAGNSGGALVNALGELVGINSRVYSRAQSSTGLGASQGPSQAAEGIGFAIPVMTAKAVLDQIVKHGRVIRGWLGADYSDVPAAVGATAHQPGVLIRQITPESPAAQSGLLPGDLLLKLDGTAIVDQLDLRNREAAIAPGTKVRLEGLRNNVTFAIDVVLAQRPAPSTTGA